MPEQELEKIPEGIHQCVIINSKMIRSRTGRYGMLLELRIKHYANQPYFHSLWFGNYKDFQDDNKRKHRVLWRLSSMAICRIGTTFSALRYNRSFGKVFLGLFKDEFLYHKGEEPVKVPIIKTIQSK